MPAFETPESFASVYALAAMSAGTARTFLASDARVVQERRSLWSLLEGRPPGLEDLLHRDLARLAARIIGNPSEAADIAGDVIVDIATILPYWLADLRDLADENRPRSDQEGWWRGVRSLRDEGERCDWRSRDPRLMAVRRPDHPSVTSASESARDVVLSDAGMVLEQLRSPESIVRLARHRLRWRCTDRFRLRLPDSLEDLELATVDSRSAELELVIKDRLRQAMVAADRLSADQQEAFWRYVLADPDLADVLARYTPDVVVEKRARYSPSSGADLGEIARAMSRSPSAVSNLLFKARQGLGDSQ
jgi:hypothetical protein